MTRFTRARAALARWLMPAERRASFDLSNWPRFLSAPALSGVVVTEETALQVATVLACARRIGADIAKLPVNVMVRTPDGRLDRAPAHPLQRVLARRPNGWQTSYEFRELMTVHALLHGDAVALKETVGGRVDALIPLVPGSFTIRQRADWKLEYDLHAPQGGVHETVGQDRVFHLRGLGWHGYKGLSLTRAAREAIGLAAALEAQQAAQMKNAGKPAGVLRTDHTINTETAENVRRVWQDLTAGPNAYGTPVLDAGFRFEQVSLSAVDAQMIESRKHQILEICAAFGVLPAAIGLDDKTQAFASVEAMMQAHVDQTVWPWARRWQERLDMDCLDGDGPHEIAFDLTEMRKASAKDQAEADVKLVTNGLRTPNELRARDGLPPLPGGNVPMRPANMTQETQA